MRKSTVPSMKPPCVCEENCQSLSNQRADAELGSLLAFKGRGLNHVGIFEQLLMVLLPIFGGEFLSAFCWEDRQPMVKTIPVKSISDYH